jgi:hypothetical protein
VPPIGADTGSVSTKMKAAHIWSFGVLVRVSRTGGLFPERPMGWLKRMAGLWEADRNLA